MIRHAVHRRGRNMDKAFHTGGRGFFQQDLGADHIGGVDFFRGIQRQGSRCVDDHIHALHDGFDRSPVADIPLQEIDFVPLRVVKIHQVNTGNIRVTFGQQISNHIYGKESANSCDQYFHLSP